ncbi:MAG: hypothetical protein KIT84_19980 [Labilithrix sp.]|nr:hypothetical protein [Labilithrix sp.]MCW5813318.1 hypothetical protein [Labilithrix sp.]
MARMSFGAVTVGRRTAVDACSTVEARTVDGARLVLLTAVQGELATPALEVVKGTFAKLACADQAGASKLAAPGLPPQLASGVAVVLVAGERVFAAASGNARCYRERAGTLKALAGASDVMPGDVFVAASHPDLTTGRAFLGAGTVAPPDDTFDDTFHNGGLDDALDAALAGHATLLSVAAAAAPK